MCLATPPVSNEVISIVSETAKAKQDSVSSLSGSTRASERTPEPPRLFVKLFSDLHTDQKSANETHDQMTEYCKQLQEALTKTGQIAYLPILVEFLHSKNRRNADEMANYVHMGAKEAADWGMFKKDTMEALLQILNADTP